MSNWIFGIFGGDNEKKADLTNKEQEFERKVEANDWIKEAMEIDEDALIKEAAYEIGDTSEDTIKKDYKLALSGMSDYNLAEMLAELNTAADQLATLDFNEEKEKILKSVKSNRSSVESKILSMIGEHTSVDWKEAFKKFEDVDHVEPSEKDLYDQMPSGKWRKKTKFTSVSDKEKIKQMEGVGKEEEKGALAKDASLKVTAYHIGDKVYYHGHPATIKDMVLNPHALEVSVTVDVDGEELHISGKELKEIGNEPLMEDLQHSEKAPAAMPEMAPEPEIEKLPEQPLPVAEEACMAKKEASHGEGDCPRCGTNIQPGKEMCPTCQQAVKQLDVDVPPIKASALKCPKCGKSESVTPASGHKLNKCDSCHWAFDNESSPDYVEPEEKEADLDVDAAGNASVIEAFVNGHAEDMKTKSSNLYMRPIISGVELVNYQTVIAVRVDDTIKISTLRYSTTTSKIQSAIISAAKAAGKPIVSMETGQPLEEKMKREPAPTPPFKKLDPGTKYDRLSSQEPEIETKASKADVIKKFALLSRNAEIDSPWGIVKNTKGEDIIARTAPTLREKKSKEKNKKVDIQSQENI